MAKIDVDSLIEADLALVRGAVEAGRIGKPVLDRILSRTDGDFETFANRPHEIRHWEMRELRSEAREAAIGERLDGAETWLTPLAGSTAALPERRDPAFAAMGTMAGRPLPAQVALRDALATAAWLVLQTEVTGLRSLEPEEQRTISQALRSVLHELETQEGR